MKKEETKEICLFRKLKDNYKNSTKLQFKEKCGKKNTDLF